MIKNLVLISASALLIYGCKPTQTVNLPEQVVEINNPNALPSQPIYNASNTRDFDLLHTKLDVKFNWGKTYLYGKAELTLKPYFFETNKLVLNARGFDVNKVQLVANGTYSDLKYVYDGLLITIDLDKTYKRTDTLKIFVDYTSKPNELESGGSNAITSDKGLYFINPDGSEKDKPQQIWTQGETQSNSAWFPTIDSPNERCTGEIAITVEEKYKTLSNGILTHQEINGNGTRTDFWEMNQPHAPYLFMMAIGEFAVVKDKWRNIEVDYYVEKDYEDDATAIFGLTPEMLEFYSKRLGVEYPWKKYSQVVVRDYVSGAMENTTAVIHGDFVQQTKRELIDGSAGEDVIAHELFHHWFGDLVTCESWSNLPLNESFATYGEYLWNEYKYGLDHADYGLQNDLNAYLQEAQNEQKDMVRFDYEAREDMFDAHTYQKGGRILHMLRNYLGDDAFFESLKYYLNKHQFTDVEMHEFRLACEDVTGKDLNWFFNQWFYASGHPILNINYDYDDASKTQIVTIEQQQDFRKTPLYKLPIKIDIYVDGKVESHTVNADEARNTFTFQVSAKPNLVNVDADKMLLCEKVDNKKDMQEWVFMYENAPKYLDRYEAISALANLTDNFATNTIVKALDDQYENIRKLAIRSLKNAVDSHNLEVKNKLLGIAKNDPKTKVRGDAISALAKYYQSDDNLKELFAAGLKNDSYTIISRSLAALAGTDKEAAMKHAKALEKETNSSISSAVASVYEMHGGAEQHAFFKEKYATLEGYGKYSFVSSYGNYLKNQNDETLNDAMPILEEITLNEKAWWVRMAGINVVAELENNYAMRSEVLTRELKKAKGTDKEADLTATIKRIGEQQDKLMAIIDKVKATEKNPYLKKMLGIAE
ncbi:MAG: M1 family metallopeptidase [Flavobacteriales bacterium]